MARAKRVFAIFGPHSEVPMKSAALEAVLSQVSSMVVPASRLERPPVPTISTGIAAVDELTGGLPRGSLTEICGPASSGRTSLLLAAIAELTLGKDVCALVDTSDSFDPLSAQQAGVDLEHLLWVRCGQPRETPSEEDRFESSQPKRGKNTTRFGRVTETRFMNSGIKTCGSTGEKGVHTRLYDGIPSSSPEFLNRAAQAEPRLQVRAIDLPDRHNLKHGRKSEFKRVEQALKATDLLLQGGGFGLIAVDFAGISPEVVRRVPLTSWFRFRRAVENTPTILLVVEEESHAKTCASLVLQLSGAPIARSVTAISEGSGPDHAVPHAELLQGIRSHAEIVRGERKPVRSAKTAFESRAAWTA